MIERVRDDPKSDKSSLPRMTLPASRLLGRRSGAVLALVVGLLSANTVSVPPAALESDFDQTPIEVESTEHRLRNLVLGHDGYVVGTHGSFLYQVQDGGDSLVEVARLPALINGLHALSDGRLVVAVDAAPHDPETPCRLYLVAPDGEVTGPILELPTATALWWSIDSDSAGNLYVGEYGVKKAGLARNVWKSTDDGLTWSIIYQAPERDGVHIHRVAVDPYTQDLWVSVGDGRDNRGVYRSTDGGQTWGHELDSQATGVLFTAEAIYWGEDFRRGGRVARLDRKSWITSEVLDARRHGRYGGSVYDMAIGADDYIYVPTMKYAMQTHTATLWRGREGTWRLIAELPVNDDGTVNAETIAGPDRDGWMYMTGFRFRPSGTAQSASLGATSAQ